VVHAGGGHLLSIQVGDIDDGNAVMLVVIRQERQKLVREGGLCIENQRVPRNELGVLRGSEYDMREFQWAGRGL
jgi:hypothetical protein